MRTTLSSNRARRMRPLHTHDAPVLGGSRPWNRVLVEGADDDRGALHEASASGDESEQGASTPMDTGVLRIASTRRLRTRRPLHDASSQRAHPDDQAGREAPCVPGRGVTGHTCGMGTLGRSSHGAVGVFAVGASRRCLTSPPAIPAVAWRGILPFIQRRRRFQTRRVYPGLQVLEFGSARAPLRFFAALMSLS